MGKLTPTNFFSQTVLKIDLTSANQREKNIFSVIGVKPSRICGGVYVRMQKQMCRSGKIFPELFTFLFLIRGEG
jgi:hypothetical protein